MPIIHFMMNKLKRNTDECCYLEITTPKTLMLHACFCNLPAWSIFSGKYYRIGQPLSFGLHYVQIEGCSKNNTEFRKLSYVELRGYDSSVLEYKLAFLIHPLFFFLNPPKIWLFLDLFDFLKLLIAESFVVSELFTVETSSHLS